MVLCIQLYNKEQLITDLDDITPKKSLHYYWKLDQGGSCVVTGTSTPSRQPTYPKFNFLCSHLVRYLSTMILTKLLKYMDGSHFSNPIPTTYYLESPLHSEKLRNYCIKYQTGNQQSHHHWDSW